LNTKLKKYRKRKDFGKGFLVRRKNKKFILKKIAIILK
jgi:hypothetical protein